MALKNFIFIFLVPYFGLIESCMGCFDQNSRLNSNSFFSLLSKNWTSFGGDALLGQETTLVTDVINQPSGVLIINEIMADPTPVADLPDREYIEIYNPGTTAINLKGWVLGLGSKQKIFPDSNLPAEGYLLVTGTGGAKDLQQYGKVVEISGFAITNSGLSITLYDSQKRLSDQIDYLPSMHRKGFEDGGFSLERIDPGRLCGQDNNWSTTLSTKGGTPGSENSVRAANPDHMPPQILSNSFVDHCRLDIQFSESVLISGNLNDMVKNIPSGLLIDSIQSPSGSGLLHICFRPGSVINGISYKIDLHGLTDECGNIMPDQNLKFGFYQPVKSDILINEVLFNPHPDGSDFVEIYNNSGHEVDLSSISIATRDEAKTLRQVYQLSASQQYMSPGSYLALTKSIDGIFRFYRTRCEDCILQMEKFPTLPDESGGVVLLNSDQDVVDEMEYCEEMHHPFITEKEGISLERIDLSVPASRKDNWHSGSKNSGFATPGYENSVVVSADSSSRMISVEPLVFSPNGDGINDQLKINIHTAKPGWLLNITILNCAGVEVRKLANNFITGSSEQLFWDGLNGDFQKVQPGIYILNISLFNLSGTQHVERFACVLTDHL